MSPPRPAISPPRPAGGEPLPPPLVSGADARGRRAAGLVSLLVGAAASICLLTGVEAFDLLLFALYQLAFILIPGVAAHGALASHPGGLLRRVCIGAALGLALELAAFMATAAAGARGAFLAYPALALLAFAIPAWRRRPRAQAGGSSPRGQGAEPHPRGRGAEPHLRAPGADSARDRFSSRQLWAVAAACACALALFAAGGLSQAPLPGDKPSVSLYPDLVWGISFAAEAKHHWPLTTPQVSGEPLRYHTFVFMQMAATSQATGIELPPVALRLVPLSLLLLLALQLAYAGRHLTGRAWAGPLAAALLLVGGDLDLAAARPEPFLGSFFSGLFLSPSFLLGLVLFVPAAIVIRDMLEQAGERAGRTPAKERADRAEPAEARARRATPVGDLAHGATPAGDLAVLALLLFACAGAKASVLPVLLGGLMLVTVRRRVRRASACLLALTAVVFVASYAALYSGSRGASQVGPLESALRLLPGSRFRELTDDGLLGALVGYPLATIVTLLALMPALAGLVWVARRRRLTDTQAWLLALLATSVAAFLLLDLPGVSQLYFLWYGFVAGALLSVEGLMAGWEAWAARGGPRATPVAVVASAVLAVLLGTGVGVGGLPLPSLYVAILLVLGAVLAACALGLLDAGGRHAGPALLAAGALIAAGALDGPLDRLPRLAQRALDPHETLHRQADVTARRGVTVDLARGLRWIRDHTDPDAVLAVNNHFLSAAGDSRYYYYSALAERRVYLESWEYTDRALAIGIDKVRAGLYPYPARLRASDAAFRAPDRARLGVLRRAGVTHLVVDRLNGPTPPATAALGRPAYANAALAVYPLRR